MGSMQSADFVQGQSLPAHGGAATSDPASSTGALLSSGPPLVLLVELLLVEPPASAPKVGSSCASSTPTMLAQAEIATTPLTNAPTSAFERETTHGL
jgi:hypothetical protein